MSIMNEMIKVLKINLRNKKAMLMMVLFPIVLMTILGAALSGTFDSSIGLKGTEVLYTNEDTGAFTSAFKSYITEIQKNGVKFIETKNTQEGLDSVKDARYACYVHIKKDNTGVEVYKNSKYNLQANIIETSLESFIQRYNMISEVMTVNPAALEKIIKDTGFDFIEERSLEGNKKPTSKDYYAISMTTLIILYGVYSATNAVKGEKIRKTGSRIMCSPVRLSATLTGKIIGAFLVTAVQVGMVVLFSMYGLKAYWGSQIWAVLLILAVEILFITSVGIGCAFMVKNDAALYPLINILIALLALLGGAYVPVETLGDTVAVFSKISPIRWINETIFQIIYNNDLSNLPITLGINLAVAVVFIIAASVIYKKEALS